MDPEEFARAMERLSSDLSSLAFEQKQERLEWRRAMEAQSAEIQHLLERQDAMQVRQDELETIAIEIEEQLQSDVKELSARIQALSERIDRLDQGQERQESSLDDLKQDVAGLSRTTDEVFDDIADRVTVFERSLAEFDRTLSKQYEVLTDSLQEARDHLTEGLAEALEAAEGHADGIIELKDAIATYQERRDEQDADAREQLSAMREQLQEQQEEATHNLEAVVSEVRAHTQREVAALHQLVSQLAAQGQMLTQALESVQQGSMKAEEQLGAALSEQITGLVRQLDQTSLTWQATLGQTQQQLKDFEAKVAKALGLQRNENLEHERHLTALRDDLTVLTNRVGTIVQLLTKASQPPRATFDPSAS